MISIGIDIGVTGAIAAVDRDGNFIGVHDMPIIQRSTYKFVDGPQLLTILSDLRAGKVAYITVEYAGFTKSASAASGMGRNLGGVVASVMIAGLPMDLTTPGKWKKHFNLIDRKATDKDRKKQARDLAVMKFPAAADQLLRAKDHNRAEAILLADYGRFVQRSGRMSS